MTMKDKRGFTLVELLVVIAIIGVLSAIVLASLNTARLKAIDAAAKEALHGAVSQAELFYYANGNSYVNVCDTASVGPSGEVKSINAQILSAARTEGLSGITITYTTAGTLATATCHDSTTGWGAEVPLKAGGMFCVDSTGYSLATGGTTIGASDVVCGL